MGIHKTHTCTHLEHLPSAVLMSCFMRHTVRMWCYSFLSDFQSSSYSTITHELRSFQCPLPQGLSLSSAILIVAFMYFLTSLHEIMLQFCQVSVSLPPYVLWFLLCDFCIAWWLLGMQMWCYSRTDCMSTFALCLFIVLSPCVPPSHMSVCGDRVFWSFAHCWSPAPSQCLVQNRDSINICWMNESSDLFLEIAF